MLDIEEIAKDLLIELLHEDMDLNELIMSKENLYKLDQKIIEIKKILLKTLEDM